MRSIEEPTFTLPYIKELRGRSDTVVMSDAQLVDLIVSSETKRHDLFTWVTSNFEELAQSETPQDGSDIHKKPLEIHNQLNTLIRYLASSENAKDVESHYIFIRISQLYTVCLLRLEKEYPGKIFDSAEFLASVLSEEDVSIDEEDGLDPKDKEKKKKASPPKKTYVYSTSKDLACTILSQLFETFGKELSSLAPLIFAVIFKNLKKIMEKSKYLHATFMTSLIQLANAILRNGNKSVLNSTFITKFAKLSKKVFEEIYADEQDFPVNFVSTIIEIWSIHFTQDSFIKDHIHDLPGTILLKYSEGELGIYGFANDETRIYTARSMAEVLFHYYYVSQALEMEQIWSFYAKFFNHSSARDTQAGCFESIIHFIGLCSAADISFFESCNYLDIVRALAGPILQSSQVKNLSMDSFSRYLRYFEYMHEIVLPRVGNASKTQILFRIMGCISSDDEKSSKENDSSMLSKKAESQWFNLAQLDLARLLLTSLSSSFGNEQHFVQQMKSKLIELSTCEIFSIRIHANEVLKVFLTNFPEYLTEVIETSLQQLSKDFKLTENFPFAINHGHALIIANLIDSADKNYVSYELIMRITVFATSFIKNHTTSTASSLYFKGIICWILLIGLVNYRDDQYLLMQSSQLFLFWKVLLTHTYSHSDEDDLYKNLEIRNHALTCLLTYIGNATIDRDVAKQVSYLLTKCSNFNHSITVKSNSIDNALLTNEHRLLQIYLKLHEYIKNDFNTSVLILIVKNFSDPNLYAESAHSLLGAIKNVGDKKISSKGELKDDVLLETSVNSLLRQNDGFAFGLSSKISNSGVSELSIKSTKRSDLHISGGWPSKDYFWYNVFENEITKPISPIFSLDYLIMLYGSGSYSGKDRYTPRVTTSLIDASMEIFSLVFPYLNSKIQYSVMESLNVSMFSKMTTPLRSVAIAANASVAIHSALRIIHENELSLDNTVGQLLMESVKKINFYNDCFLIRLKADCIGLISAAVSRGSPSNSKQAYVLEQAGILIKNVVEVDEPYLRILHTLSLAAVYKYNPQIASFASIFEVIVTLIKDPHPVVHSWSLKAMHVLLEKHLAIDLSSASKLFLTLEDVAVDPAFGIHGSSILRYNYNREFNSHLVIGQIIRTLTETMGPNIPELNRFAIDSFKSITYAGITSNDVVSKALSLGIYENLATFKLNGILCDQIFIKSAKRTIDDAIITGFGSNYYSCDFTKDSQMISSTSSIKAALDNFGLFTQLLRLKKKSFFVKEMDILSWRYLYLHSSSSLVIKYFYAWLEQSYEDEPRWFDKLYLMFNMSRVRLFQGFYKEVDLMMQAKGFNKPEEKEIRAEEEKSIAKVDQMDFQERKGNSSDTIPWEAKEVILELIKYVCLKSEDNKEVFSILSRRVSELIRVSFQASTTRIASMKGLGLDILTILLREFSKVKDPESPEHSILEQQEAQITSALMPAFDAGSSPDVIACAINVAAEFLGSNIVPLERMSRISQLLVRLLGFFSEKGASITVGEANIITQKARRKTELAVLNAWAGLVHNSLLSNNEEVITFTRGYWDILVPLWIISLREYVMVKYEGVKTDEELHIRPKETLIESQSAKLELYDSVWLNFVVAIGSILEADPAVILKCLNEVETESFIFILFSQCMEVIVKHIDDHSIKMKVLPALHNILKSNFPLNSLFEDAINDEIIGILDRLMIMGNDKERMELVNIINDLIVGYLKQNNSHELFLQGIDKLYELLRLLLMPISDLLPFVRYNTPEENVEDKLSLHEVDVLLIKRAFSVFESHVRQFDDVFKLDLYSCLLYIMGRIYEAEVRDIVIPSILPLLKSIAKNLIESGKNIEMLDIFFACTKSFIFEKVNRENQLATILILITNGYDGFTSEELEISTDLLVAGLHDSETQLIAVHGFKTIIHRYHEYRCCSFVLRNAIKKFGQSYAKKDSDVAPKIMLEIVMLFTKEVIEREPEKGVNAFALNLTFILSFYQLSSDNFDEASDKIIALMKLNTETFKLAVNKSITADQKNKIESIIENTPQFSALNGKGLGNAPLELRSFS